MVIDSTMCVRFCPLVSTCCSVQAMVDELDTLGITLMVTFWPFQSRESIHWTEFESNGYLVPRLNGTLDSWDGGDQYLYDPFNPAARKAVFRE